MRRMLRCAAVVAVLATPAFATPAPLEPTVSVAKLQRWIVPSLELSFGHPIHINNVVVCWNDWHAEDLGLARARGGEEAARAIYEYYAKTTECVYHEEVLAIRKRIIFEATKFLEYEVRVSVVAVWDPPTQQWWVAFVTEGALAK